MDIMDINLVNCSWFVIGLPQENMLKAPRIEGINVELLRVHQNSLAHEHLIQ